MAHAVSTLQATSLRPATLKERKLHITTECLLTGLLGCVRKVTSGQAEGFPIAVPIDREAEWMIKWQKYGALKG